MKKCNQYISELMTNHECLISQKNAPDDHYNGIYRRWKYPVVTPDHAPISWRYDIYRRDHGYVMERLGVNATFNPGAIYFDGKYVLVVRVEGNDRKSFFAIAESDSGVDNFRFRDYPIDMPETSVPDTNIYDMRLTRHEDGYIYGLFCSERKDQSNMHDVSAAIAKCGIARTVDLVHWERLPDLETQSQQQRNVVLHPEFVEGKYALYTRPQDGFVNVGSGGGIGWALVEDIANAVVRDEMVIDQKVYHTIKEVKNGQGPAPIKTSEGWLHLAHGVRNTAAGLRYVLYMFMTSVDEPWRVTHRPGGHFLAPLGDERVGDVPNVCFSNGWITNGQEVYIYYASADTRVHVVTTTVEKLIDYVINTPEDGLTSSLSVKNRIQLIDKNMEWMSRG